MPLFRKIQTRKKTPNILNLKEFSERNKKVLIIRETGGLGDILMHRMMFEDFKKIAPDIKIVFACLPQYINIVKDHPFIDEVVSSKDVDQSKFITCYTTTCACTRYEMSVAPKSGLHRSDIWAANCGVALQNHNMHFRLSKEVKDFGYSIIEKLRKGHKGPSVLLCPISAMIVKNLTKNQLLGTANFLRDSGCFVIGSHIRPITDLTEVGIDTVCGTTMPQLLGLVNAADYVVSVDTGQFHAAGGLNKPLTGIFTFCDGKVYSKYYQAELVQKHRDNGDWDCGPCYNWGLCPKTEKVPKPCLTEITTNMITDGIIRMFKRWQRNC